MQILKSIPVHATVQKTLTYILNPNKTEDLLYTASMNCMTDPVDAYYNMKMIYEGYSGKSFDTPPPKKGERSGEGNSLHPVFFAGGKYHAGAGTSYCKGICQENIWGRCAVCDCNAR